MKKALILLSGLIFLFAPTALAASYTPSSTATTSGSEDLLNRIKDKVNQIDQKKGYVGKIRTLGNNSFSLTTDSGETYVEVNDATNLYFVRAGARSTIEYKNLKIGDDLSVIGISDDSTKTVTARQIVDKVRRKIVFGKVSEIEKGSISLILSDNSTKSIDLPTSQTFKKYSKGSLIQARLTDVTAADVIVAVGVPDTTDPSLLSTLKAYLLQQALFTPSPEATPSAR